jgi:hypothetical protein
MWTLQKSLGATENHRKAWSWRGAVHRRINEEVKRANVLAALLLAHAGVEAISPIDSGSAFALSHPSDPEIVTDLKCWIWNDVFRSLFPDAPQKRSGGDAADVKEHVAPFKSGVEREMFADLCCQSKKDAPEQEERSIQGMPCNP